MLYKNLLDNPGLSAGTFGNAIITPVVTVNSSGIITNTANVNTRDLNTARSIAVSLIFS